MPEDQAPKPKDLVLVRGRTEDGKGLEVLRSKADQVEAGIMKPLEEGKPLDGEVVKLTPRPECPLLFDAETQFSTNEVTRQHPELPARTTGGPPQVASDEYRRNWDAIYKRRKKNASLN
jgi:hypothetical protein